MEKENIIKLINELGINNSTNETLNINNTVFYKNTNALMMASYFGFDDIVQNLIENGININAKDINGKSAIMFAIENNNIESWNRRAICVRNCDGLVIRGNRIGSPTSRFEPEKNPVFYEYCENVKVCE